MTTKEKQGKCLWRFAKKLEMRSEEEKRVLPIRRISARGLKRSIGVKFPRVMILICNQVKRVIRGMPNSSFCITPILYPLPLKI